MEDAAEEDEDVEGGRDDLAELRGSRERSSNGSEEEEAPCRLTCV